MTFQAAAALFAAMSFDRKEHVLRIFDQTRASPAFHGLDDAFAGAVADEAYAIERETLFGDAAVLPPLAPTGPLQYADTATCTASRVAAARNRIRKEH